MKSPLSKFLFLAILWLGVLCNVQADDGKCQFIPGSVDIGAGKIAYLNVGTGKPVVLLHGLFAQKEQWNDLACQLSKSGFAVYMPDLPGYGQSTGFTISDYRLSQQVELIHLFTQKLKLNRFNIAGNSMGGAIAALIAKRYPGDVVTLAFFGAPMGIVPWSDQIRGAMYQGVNPFIPITIDQFDLEMRLLFANPPKIDQSVKESAIKEYSVNNRHYQQVWDIVNLDIAVLNPLEKSSKPTLIVWGQDDGIFNVSGRKLLDQKYPKASSSAIPNASHLIMLEKPNELAKMYQNFLYLNKQH
jgi:pimeloyl-ACP methyl ester carboxylesterase